VNDEWAYAELEDEQLAFVLEAEASLDADVVLAFRPVRRGTVDPDAVAAHGLQPIDLDQAQLDRLRGLEGRSHSVLVAYRQANS